MQRPKKVNSREKLYYIEEKKTFDNYISNQFQFCISLFRANFFVLQQIIFSQKHLVAFRAHIRRNSCVLPLMSFAICKNKKFPMKDKELCLKNSYFLRSFGLIGAILFYMAWKWLHKDRKIVKI
jgi:hypothetical protein